MTLDEIAAHLREVEPDRFGASLLTKSDARAKLWTLYALNLETARAPLQSNEPLIAEMRVQWWIDQLNRVGLGLVGDHELLDPLAKAWGPEAGELAVLAEARRQDSDREPHSSADAVEAYIRATALPLSRLAARAIGVPAPASLDDQALGNGLASWLGALPALQSLGLGLKDRDPKIVEDLATRGLDALARARAERRSVPRTLAPAYYGGPAARQVLETLAKDGTADIPPVSEFRHRLGLGRLALTGRWWS